MKKKGKSTLTRLLDKECSRIVRGRGFCAMCNSVDYQKLQCAHIFSRTYRNTRWNLHNLLCLCAGCHFKGHRSPIEFTEFVKAYLGDNLFQALKSSHIAIKRWTLSEMQELLETLQEL